MLLTSGLMCGVAAGQTSPAPMPLTEAELQDYRSQVAVLESRLAELRRQSSISTDLWADANVFVKAAIWGLDFGPVTDAKSRGLLNSALRRAGERIDALKAGQPKWESKRGKLARGFISEVDGSTQPFGLVIPESYDASRPIRLDVVLHGSRRAVGIGELQFLSLFDSPDDQIVPGTSPDWIELHPLGRLGENAYRFEGETDVDEALAYVRRHYNIDRSQIVLRGGSLGGVGAWQLGLKRPDRYVAIAPACGPVDTYVFAASPRSNFKPLDPMMPWHKQTLHLVDAVDYTANARMVPTVALMGEFDEYMSSHRLIEAEFKKEGIPFAEVIEKGVGHGLTKKGYADQMALLKPHVDHPSADRDRNIHFTTWTLKFNRCFWIELLGLERHYQRARIQAALASDGSVTMDEPANITRLALHAPALTGSNSTLTIAGKAITLESHRPEADRPVVLARENGEWRVVEKSEPTGKTKRPGLQGPIDDAFATKFLCVRGTGTPWNPAVGAWANATLERFADEWRRHYRGVLPVKDDRDVTDQDVRTSNLILFGDPGSNSWIARALSALPAKWSKERVALGKHQQPAEDHGLALIAPSPFTGGEGKYVVLNSGHTYHDTALQLSYMVYPRLGDWAVIKVGQKQPDSSQGVDETVLQSGFFDETWQDVIESP